jgi:hypothetical protein
VRPKSKAVLDPEARVRELTAYQEAFHCLRKGEQPLLLTSGEDDREVKVELLGAARAAGGVIVDNEGAGVRYADDWIAANQEHIDPYVRDLVHKVQRARDNIITERVRKHGSARPECINALCEGVKSVSEVRARIESLFSDKDDAARVTLTTTHKAKGLERERCWILSETFRPNRGTGGANLWYVAVTRAKSEL